MELNSLMTGIGVVIDDALESSGVGEGGGSDLIFEILQRLEREWNLPFYESKELPSERSWPNLLQAASFILLDWKLWPTGASQLEEEGIRQNTRFLKEARDHFVPVFIFTNESLEDVENKLPESVYRKESPERNFIFLRRKEDMIVDDSLDFAAIKDWIRGNASVYALKTWEETFYSAKKELFGAMYARSPAWPGVFWQAYKDDSVDPSSSLTQLINDSLRGRIRTNAFEDEVLAAADAEIPKEDLQALIAETSFRRENTLPEDEIRCGDLFRQPKGKFLLNLRPDCDCIPRNGSADEVKLYCVEGKGMSDADLGKQFQREQGNFSERVWESVAFAIYDGKSLRFDFRRLRLAEFSELRDQRIGRLLHPYLTRIQQRYALYQQRQALPRIPGAAVP